MGRNVDTCDTFPLHQTNFTMGAKGHFFVMTAG
jgi:hypothetical protein